MGVTEPVSQEPTLQTESENEPTANDQDKSIIKEFKEAMDKRRPASRPPRRGKIPPHRRKTRKEHLRLRPQRPRPNNRLLLRTSKPRTTGKVRQRRKTRTRPNRRRDRRILRHAHVRSQIRPARAPHPSCRHPQHTHPPQPRSPPNAKTPPSAAPKVLSLEDFWHEG